MYSKWTGLAVLLLLVLVLAVPIVVSGGENGFWMWFTPSVTPEGHAIGELFNWVLWLCAVLFVVVHGFMLYFVLAYPSGSRESTPHTHGHLGIEVTWTLVPTLLMIILGIYTYNVYAGVIESHEDPFRVNVTAEQFRWKVKYPGNDITLSNRMVLPTNRNLQIEIESKDVLHSFFVPAFRMKQDAVPGMKTIMNISRITKTGEYDIRCAELCGVGHYRMTADLQVITSEAFEEWIGRSDQDARSNYLRKVLNSE